MLVAGIRYRLSTRPFKQVYDWVEDRKRPGSSQSVPLRRIVWSVKKVARFVPEATCLTQAFATQILCARYGFQTMLRVGVDRSEKGTLEAHAWVEYQGYVIIGHLPNLERYQVMPSLAS